MSGYSDPSAVWETASGIKVDPNDPAFRQPATSEPQDEALPAIYLFSNSRNGDGLAYSMAEDGTVLGEHFCSHWGYMRLDLHDRPDRRAACAAHYPDGYRLVVLTEPGALPPSDVLARNEEQRAVEVSA